VESNVIWWDCDRGFLRCRPCLGARPTGAKGNIWWARIGFDAQGHHNHM